MRPNLCITCPFYFGPRSPLSALRVPLHALNSPNFALCVPVLWQALTLGHVPLYVYVTLPSVCVKLP